MEFKIKRKYILSLGQWIAGLALSGQQSRNRTKFVEQLSEEIKESELVRIEIVKKYGVLDEKGEPKLVEKDGKNHYDIPDDKLEAFNKEIADYMEQDYVSGGPGLETRLRMVGEIVLETQEKITGDIASDYDAWCDAFEAMLKTQ